MDSRFHKTLCTFYLFIILAAVSDYCLADRFQSILKFFALNPRISLFWQHGQGRHFWNTSQGGGGHFFLSSQYTGEFVQGQRHGHGKICFASGATYVGEWKHDKNQEKVQLLQSGLCKVIMPPTKCQRPRHTGKIHQCGRACFWRRPCVRSNNGTVPEFKQRPQPSEW